jgi:hypothetical protein
MDAKVGLVSATDVVLAEAIDESRAMIGNRRAGVDVVEQRQRPRSTIPGSWHSA